VSEKKKNATLPWKKRDEKKREKKRKKKKE
jgi:hypothetical protein